VEFIRDKTKPNTLQLQGYTSQLGFNISCLENGFNKRNTKNREACFHGETLKHILNSSRAENFFNWFNVCLRKTFSSESVGRTKLYIMDGMKIFSEYRRFERTGVVKKPHSDKLEYGYKMISLQEVVDKKTIINAFLLDLIERHDIELGKELLRDMDFEKGSALIMDRGFISAEWFEELYSKKKLDIYVPLRSNMTATQHAVSTADVKKLWEEHPTRKNQEVAFIKEDDFYYPDSKSFQCGALVRWKNKDGDSQYVFFVSTKKHSSAKEVLEIYDLRAQIEESHKQLKCFQEIGVLLRKKFTHIVFQVCMHLISYNLLNIFLNSEECDSLDDFTLITMRQKRRITSNPDLIIYADNNFGIFEFLDFMDIVLELPKQKLRKIQYLIKALKQQQKERFNSS